MSLADVVRNGVALANSLTTDLQDTVTIRQWTGRSGSGTPTYGAPIVVKAIVEYRQEVRRASTGEERVSRAYVAILQPIAPNGAPGRKEPLDEEDEMTLPDGTKGTIVEVKGLVDPSIHRPYFFEVWMGRSQR